MRPHSVHSLKEISSLKKKYCHIEIFVNACVLRDSGANLLIGTAFYVIPMRNQPLCPTMMSQGDTANAITNDV